MTDSVLFPHSHSKNNGHTRSDLVLLPYATHTPSSVDWKPAFCGRNLLAYSFLAFVPPVDFRMSLKLHQVIPTTLPRDCLPRSAQLVVSLFGTCPALTHIGYVPYHDYDYDDTPLAPPGLSSTCSAILHTKGAPPVSSRQQSARLDFLWAPSLGLFREHGQRVDISFLLLETTIRLVAPFASSYHLPRRTFASSHVSSPHLASASPTSCRLPWPRLPRL
ncbi:hypothetical protein K438DRAFT_684073 [Mycena galopus ATCC 62051]|nr:hypothetical protein K438DRAFT_684073 [Mycena galopus ATCC 62051]